jgi:ABC-type nitrate/sulfonate/bicarbonate transport system substrate-binding protein
MPKVWHQLNIMTSSHRRGSWLLAGVATLALALLAYFSLQSRAVTPQHTIDRIRIAGTVGAAGRAVFIAEAEGYWAEEGVDVSFLPTIHGKAALELLASESTDLAMLADTPFT